MDDGNYTLKGPVPVGTRSAELILTMDLDTFYLNVSGTIPTLELALAMLEQAKRHFEAQLRMIEAQQMLAGPRAALPGELAALKLGRKV